MIGYGTYARKGNFVPFPIAEYKHRAVAVRCDQYVRAGDFADNAAGAGNQRDQRAEGKYSADQRMIICQNAIEYYEYGCGYA